MEPEICSDIILGDFLKASQTQINVDSKKTPPFSDQGSLQNFHQELCTKMISSASSPKEKNDLLNEISPTSHNSSSSSNYHIKNSENNENLSKSNSMGKYSDTNYEQKPLLLKRSNNQVLDNNLETDPFLQDPIDLLYAPKNCAESVEQFAKYVWKNGWKAMPHHALPNWLRDNDYLLSGHRPPLPSCVECFKSIFRIHTETGNIWTHLIGALSFIGVATYFLTRPNVEIQFQEKVVFGAFFLGAIICLFCSALFHTFYCYSPSVSKFFNKIDYCGISVLTIGSFVPWLYYAFYCESVPKVVYLIFILMLGVSCIIVSLWEKFSEPEFRAIRAGMFIALGLSGVVPAIHYSILFGGYKAFNVGALGWLILMAVLYIVGACLYAARIPEKLFPGRFDIWFQSHQIFHVFVVLAAYVHYHGITKLASYRLTLGDCLTAHIEADFSFEF